MFNGKPGILHIRSFEQRVYAAAGNDYNCYFADTTTTGPLSLSSRQEESGFPKAGWPRLPVDLDSRSIRQMPNTLLCRPFESHRRVDGWPKSARDKAGQAIYLKEAYPYAPVTLEYKRASKLVKECPELILWMIP